MALTISAMPRKFFFKKNGQEIQLPDTSTNLSPDQIMAFYSAMYPDLTTASVHGPDYKENELVYEFKTTVGVKG